MIGRESDLAALREELAVAARGEPRAVVIGGEAGIGKSRLIAEFLAEAAGGDARGVEATTAPPALVLLGRCVDLGSDAAPYAPFTAILRRLVGELGIEQVLEAAGPGAGVLSVLLPELADDEAVPARTWAERLYELVTVLLERVSAERPVVVAIEDVHWADSATLELVRFVVRMAERGRLLVLLSYRSDEVARGHALRSWLPELDRTRRVTRWELARLGREQVGTLVASLLGCRQGAGAEAVGAAAGGEPGAGTAGVGRGGAEGAGAGRVGAGRGGAEGAGAGRAGAERASAERVGVGRVGAERVGVAERAGAEPPGAGTASPGTISAGTLDAEPVDPETVDRVYRLSEGVPFFVEELAGIDGLATGEDLPETLRELLLARYERLSEPAQRLLRLLSAGGVCVEHELLAAVFDGTAEELDAAAREALVANVLTADSTEYTFRHALVREAIHADLLPGERGRFHTRYALALEASPRRSASQLSSHWMAAHDLRRAFIASLEAMEEARLSYAYAAAAAMGARALELWESVPDAEELSGRSRTELISRTASALRNAGDSERALALVNVALDDAAGLPPEKHARLLRDKAQYLANLSRPGSTELLREALEVVPAAPGADEPRDNGLGADGLGAAAPGADDLRAQLLAELAGRLMVEARYEEAIEKATQSIAAAPEQATARRSVAHNVRGIALVDTGRVEHGLAELEAARTLAGSDAGPLLRYAVNASDAMNLLGRYADAVRIAETGAEQARVRGVERTSGVMLSSNTVEPLLALGELDRAERLLDPALALDPPPGFRVHLRRMKLWLTLWRGDVDGADELLRRWRTGMLVQAAIEMQSRLGFARVAAEIAIARGENAVAWEEASVITAEGTRSIPAYDLPLLAAAARALAELAEGRNEAVDVEREAGRLEAVLARLAEWPTFPVWGPVVVAELATARLAAGVPVARAASTSADGAAAVREAWAHAAEAALLPVAPTHLRPYALLRSARLALAAGDRPAAEREAAEARELAERSGLGLLVAAADTIAAPRASRSLRGQSAPAAALTEREEQVLALIEQGLSNRQIGERLFISAKTASVHVSSILRKVGASTRTEAVYRAARVR